MDLKTEVLKRLYDNGYRYIARDADGEIYAFDYSPIKRECAGSWEIDSFKFCSMGLFSDVFTDITWGDPEPFYIGKHLGLIDWPTVSVDTKVLVRDYDEEDWEHRYFAGFDPHATEYPFLVFDNGATSWSNDGAAPDRWKQCKLAEDNDD